MDQAREKGRSEWTHRSGGLRPMCSQDPASPSLIALPGGRQVGGGLVPWASCSQHRLLQVEPVTGFSFLWADAVERQGDGE